MINGMDPSAFGEKLSGSDFVGVFGLRTSVSESSVSRTNVHAAENRFRDELLGCPAE
jgi:hypothetical protein